MKDRKIRRITMAAALASSFLASPAMSAFERTASEVMASLSMQMKADDYAASRAMIHDMQANGIGALVVGTERISLEDLLGMIASAEAGRMDPVALSSYLAALSTSTAKALFVPAQVATDSTLPPTNTRGSFPVGSHG